MGQAIWRPEHKFETAVVRSEHGVDGIQGNGIQGNDIQGSGIQGSDLSSERTRCQIATRLMAFRA
ncbi:MAG: hypothetical protein ABW001_00485 [Mycobacterium sp.]